MYNNRGVYEVFLPRVWEPELEPTRPESREDTIERMLSTDPLRASTSSLIARSGRSSRSSISTSSSFSEWALINI